METSRVLQTPRARVGEEVSGPNLAAAYDAHAAPLYRYLVTLLSSAEDAEDALQDVFLALARRPTGRIRELRAYLFQAARNQAFIALRKRRKHQKEQAAAALSWIDPEECAPEQREIAIDIDRALRQLPPEQREAIVLKLSAGLTFREIAEVLGIPLGTAASRYRLALARLRCLLEGGDDHD